MDPVEKHLLSPAWRALKYAGICFIPGTLLGFFVGVLGGGMSCCAGDSNNIPSLLLLANILMPIYLLQLIPLGALVFLMPVLILVVQPLYYFTVFFLIFVCWSFISRIGQNLDNKSIDPSLCSVCGTRLEGQFKAYCKKCGAYQRRLTRRQS